MGWPQSYFSPVWLRLMHAKAPDWFKPRGYAHFDSPLSLKAADQLVSERDRVSRHSFFPFLRYTVQTQKVERDRVSGKISPKMPKLREISFAAHSDSHIYSYYSFVLAEQYEKALSSSGVSDSVLAFRSLGKSNIHFASDAFGYIEELGECVAFATDITGFFDNLDHIKLKKAWCSLLDISSLPPDHFAVFKSITQYAYVERNALYRVLGLSSNNPPSPPASVVLAKYWNYKKWRLSYPYPFQGASDEPGYADQPDR